jgi:hypothetical protein
VSTDLSYRAYQLRCEIQRVLASTPPGEAPDRIEDVAHDALDKLAGDFRRARRREVFGSAEE